jgi:hypothetical protein
MLQARRGAGQGKGQDARQGAGRVFFFWKKRSKKTFVRWVGDLRTKFGFEGRWFLWLRPLLNRLSGLAAKPEEKFFASFFQKRRFLLSATWLPDLAPL